MRCGRRTRGVPGVRPEREARSGVPRGRVGAASGWRTRTSTTSVVVVWTGSGDTTTARRSGGFAPAAPRAEEFLGMQGGGAPVLGPKRHGVGRDGDEPVIGEADAVGVAAEILEESLRPAEGALHVDEPWGVVERAERATGRDGIGGRQLAP